MTLADLLRTKGRLSQEEFLPVFRRIATAVALYQVDHPLYGDLRPVNILIEEHGASLKTHGTGDPPQDYLAPEQLMGKVVTAATDIYALGLIGFEMLTARNPAAGLDITARKTGQLPILAPEAPHVSEAVTGVIERCLVPDPAKRFPSVRELIDALGGHLPLSAISLAEILPEDAPDPREAVPLFREAVLRVARFHDQKVPHASINAKNLRIQETGEVELPPAAGPDDAFPDPKYAAPETILSGSPAPLDLASDVYSLGFLFYEVLLGTKQFAAEFGPVLARQSDLAWLQWHADAARRARPLRELRSDLPSTLVDLVMHMIDKNSVLRVKSLDAIQSELTRVDASFAA